MRIQRAIDIAVAVLAIDAGATVLKRASRRPAPSPSEQAAGAPHSEFEPQAIAAGALADKPSDMPARGWKQILKRVYASIGDDRVMAEAASVTYYTLLAIFPAIASLISLYGLIADPSNIGKTLASLQGVVPEGGMTIINDQIKSLISAPHQALGFGFAIGLLTSLWSANAGIKSLFDALNAVYEEKESRTFLHRTWLSLAFTAGALAFVILALFAVVAVPAILNFVGLGAIGATLLDLGRWPVMLIAIMGFLALTYRYGPSRAKAKWRWISWGSAFAGTFWIIASAAFSWYAANFGNYNKTYGSLGAAIGFMTWIWISTIIVLIGAELNAEMEHQTARDSTVAGRPQVKEESCSFLEKRTKKLLSV